MWRPDEIVVEIVAADRDTMIVAIATPAGLVELIGTLKREGRVLRVDGAHVQGLRPGALGRAGLNAIGRKLLEEADVDQVIIAGGTRSTGASRGKRPRPVRFPCPLHAEG